MALASNDIDVARTAALGRGGTVPRRQVAGRDTESATPTWSRHRPSCWPGFEPEDESPIVFLRLRKAARAGDGRSTRSPRWPPAGWPAVRGVLVPVAPGAETEVLHPAGRRGGTGAVDDRGRPALTADGAVILAGERLAGDARRAVGAAPAGRRDRRAAGLGAPPGRRARRDRGRRPADAASRRAPRVRPGGAGRGGPGLGSRHAPRRSRPGRAAILAAAAAGDLDALVVAGVDPGDLPDPTAALAALEATPFRGEPGTAGQRRHRPGGRGAARWRRCRRRPGRS